MLCIVMEIKLLPPHITIFCMCVRMCWRLQILFLLSVIYPFVCKSLLSLLNYNSHSSGVHMQCCALWESALKRVFVVTFVCYAIVLQLHDEGYIVSTSLYIRLSTTDESERMQFGQICFYLYNFISWLLLLASFQRWLHSCIWPCVHNCVGRLLKGLMKFVFVFACFEE